VNEPVFEVNEPTEDEERFHEFNIGSLGDFDVQLFGTKSLHIYTDWGKLVVKNRALTQLLHLMGLSKRDLKGSTAERVQELIRQRDDIVLSAVEIDDGIFYVFRAVTEGYVAIPHRVLFDYAKGVLREMGLDVEPNIVRYTRRTVAYFPLFKVPLKYGRPNDAVCVMLGVSNANTGAHSIKVYGYAEILVCANGAIIKDFASRIRVFHVSDIKSVLRRVGDAIKDVVGQLREKSDWLARRIESLEKVEIEEWKINTWLELMSQRLPKKYRKWFARVFYGNREAFGDTAEALFQTLTYFVPRLMKVNEDLATRLNSEANKILERPAKYVEAIASR